MQSWIVILNPCHLPFQIVNSICLLHELINVFAGTDSSNRHQRVKDLRLYSDKSEMLFMIILECMSYYGCGQIEGRELFKIFEGLGELSIGSGSDDIFLDFLLLF